MKLKKVVINGFRGIRDELIIEPDGQSLVIIGENSMGKSSAAHSFEWFLNSEHLVEHLRGEGMSQRDYLHCLVADKKGICSVKMDFSDSTLEKSLQPSDSLIALESDPTKFNELYNKLIVPPCFGYLDVARFVMATKGEKYKILAGWMGFEHLMNEQIILKMAQEEVKQFLKNLFHSFNQKKLELEKVTGLEKINSQKIIVYCNEILIEVSQNQITKVEDLVERLEVLRQLETSAKSERLANLISCKNQIDGQIFENFQSQISKLAAEGVEITKKIDIDLRWRTESLYQVGLKTILDQTVSQDSCPLCKTPWSSTLLKEKNALLEHIKAELANLKVLGEQRSVHATSVELLLAKLQAEVLKISEFKMLLSRSFLAIGYSDRKVLEAVEKYLEMIRKHAEILKFKKWDEVDVLNLQDTSARLDKCVKSFSEALMKEEKKLLLTDKDKKIAEIFSKLENIKNIWLELKAMREKYDFMNKEKQKFEDICVRIESILKESIQKRFEEVSGLIQKYFDILRPPSQPCNDISEIKLRLFEEGKGAGRLVEVEFTYHSRKGTSPPRRVLTESHLNALGIATYLALIRHLNVDAKFVVLDDVINSLDQNHRHHFAKLISSEFADFQIILFTHDEIFFEEILSEMRNAKRLRLLNWSFENGPDTKLAANKLARVERSINDGEAYEAMRNLSLYIESKLNMLCENLGARTRHTYYDRARHCSSELFNALEGVCKELKSSVSLKNKFQTNKISIVLRNFVSHDWNNLASGVSLTEVKGFYAEWLALEEEFKCSNCDRWLIRPSNENFAVCKCGRLRMPQLEGTTL